MIKKYITALCAACLGVLVSFSCLAACNGDNSQEADKKPDQGTEKPDDTGNPGDKEDPEKPDVEAPSEDDKNYADVFIFMGQSNMSGQGKAAEAIACGEGHGYEFRAVSGSDEAGWLYPVAEPFGATENNSAISDYRRGGLVSSFCESYYNETGVPVIAVSASISGSSIQIWQPDQPAYEEAVRRLNACTDYLADETEYSVRHVNMVWCQGETDSWTMNNPNGFDYFACLEKLYDGMAEDAGVENCFMITPSIYTDNALVEYKQMMAEAQAEYCAENENFVMVARKFENVPLNLRDDPHFYQGIYNVCGWEAGKNTASFLETGEEAECKPYAEGEAEELADRFGIKLSYNVPLEPVDPDGEYVIQETMTSNIIATPGVWGYYFEGRAESDFDDPVYSHGTITWNVRSYMRDDSKQINDSMILRYQPDMEVGAKYKMQFTVTFEGTGKDNVYIKFGNEWYNSDNSPYVTKNDDGSFTVNYSGTVSATQPFLIQVTARNGAGDVAFTMTVSDIKLSAG